MAHALLLKLGLFKKEGAKMFYHIHSESNGYVSKDAPESGFEYCDLMSNAKRFTKEEIDALYQDLSMDHPLSDISIVEA